MSNENRESVLRSLARHADKNTMKKLDREVKYVALPSKHRVDRHRCFGLMTPVCDSSRHAPRVRVRLGSDGGRKRILLQKFIFWMKLEESNKRAMYNSLEGGKRTKMCDDANSRADEFFARGTNRVRQTCPRRRRVATGALGGKAYKEFDFYCMNPNHVHVRMPERRRRAGQREEEEEEILLVDDDDDDEQRDVDEESAVTVGNLTKAAVGIFQQERSVRAEDDERSSDDDQIDWDDEAVGDLFNGEDARHRSTVFRIMVNKNDPNDRFLKSAKILMGTARDQGLQVL